MTTTSEVLPLANSNGNGPGSVSVDKGRVIPNGQMIFWSCLVGFVGGLLAIAYYYVLQGALTLVWPVEAHVELESLALLPRFNPLVLGLTTAGGLVVGLVLKFLGSPGEIAAVVNNIHMERGRIDPAQTPSMVAASLASITAGGSAGPEAPLVQILGSFGSWVGDKLNLRGDLVRTLTFCGMGAALGAFFGAPLGGALFALEIPHRRGLEYFEALVPTILAALIAFFVFRAATGYEAAIYLFEPMKDVSLLMVSSGVLFGLIGGAVGTLFILLFGAMEKVMHPLAKHKVLLATLGGLGIGLIAQVSPVTLFWSEYQIKTLLAAGPGLVHVKGLYVAAGILLGIAGLKMVAVGATLHSGFRGGFIFPLFFIGAAIGLAVTLVFPGLPGPIVILSMMAAVNVAVTKTPISTAIILTTLAGTAVMPGVVAASFASFLLTTRISLIRTQRSRGEMLVAVPQHE